MTNHITATRYIRSTRHHEVGILEKEKVTNAVKYAARVPMSDSLKTFTKWVGVFTGGFGAALIVGIHRFCHRHPAATQAMQRQQSEATSKTIFAKKEKNDEQNDCIDVVLRDGSRITATEEHGKLWIDAHDGKGKVEHPEANNIDELKAFCRDDLKNNIDYYISKNPDSQLLKLYQSAIANGTIDALLDSMEAITASDYFDQFQTNIRKLEEIIETRHPQFKGILQVEVTEPERKKFAHKVVFGDDQIARLGFSSELNPKLFEPAPAIMYNERTAAEVGKPHTLQSLLHKVKTSPNSIAFQANILKLSRFCEETDENFKGLSLSLNFLDDGATEVSVNINDITVEFKGELTLNDRIFEKIPNSESEYQLKPLTNDIQLIQDLFIQSADIHAAVYATPVAKRALQNAHGQLPNLVSELRRDISRNGPNLPAQGEGVVGWTKDEFLATCHQYMQPNISQRSEQFKEFYDSYSKLSRKEQNVLCKAIDGEEKSKASNIVEVNESEPLLKMYKQFYKLEKTEQTRMIECLHFFCSGKFVGTAVEFADAFDKLPFKEKVEMLMLFQGFRTSEASVEAALMNPAVKRGVLPVNKGAIESSGQIVWSDVGHQLAQIRITSRNEINSRDEIVARQEVVQEFDLVIPEIGGLKYLQTQFNEEELKFSVAVLNQDGSMPKVLENANTELESDMPSFANNFDWISMDYFEQQLQRDMLLRNATYIF